MKDKFPGKPKILFIALAQSTHTHAWVNLLHNQELNVRVFGINRTAAPDDFNFETYLLDKSYPCLNPKRKLSFKGKSLLISGISYYVRKDLYWLEERWLAKIIKNWKPDIIHTLGLDPASFIFYRVRERYNLQDIGIWVVTARGGPELSLRRLIPEEAERIRKVFESCDQFIADNQMNYNFALELGLDSSKLSPLGVVPGTGGVNVDKLSRIGKVLPSQRKRIIVWPKAYECPASKALPVFEALRLCWKKIKPCEIYMTAMIPETRMWVQTLPSEIRSSCHVEDRIPQEYLLELMAQARVMLAPSLTDGIPNTLYEAMATRAFPILSPLDTIKDVVHDGQNVLFARNLYPQEIADALVMAMSDDKLVDTAAANNYELVRKLADRNVIATKIANYYNSIGNKNGGVQRER